MKIKNEDLNNLLVDILSEGLCQSMNYNNEHYKHHQWLSLISEEFLELTQAVNETDEYTATEKAELYGGTKNIYCEGVQVAALLIRYLLHIKRLSEEKAE